MPIERLEQLQERVIEASTTAKEIKILLENDMLMMLKAKLKICLDLKKEFHD